MRAFPAVGFVAGVAAVALLPLFGDPQPAAVVSHPEWARMVLRSYGVEFGPGLKLGSPPVIRRQKALFSSSTNHFRRAA